MTYSLRDELPGGSYSREGVIFSMPVPRGGVNRELFKGSYSRKYGILNSVL